jgi:hypothetical protein
VCEQSGSKSRHTVAEVMVRTKELTYNNRSNDSCGFTKQADCRSKLSHLTELATPQVKRQRGQGLTFPWQGTVAQEINDVFVSPGVQPMKCCADDFFSVTMEFRNKGRQKGERVAAQGAKKASDRNRIRFCQRDKTANVAPMPPQTPRLLAKLTLAGL